MDAQFPKVLGAIGDLNAHFLEALARSAERRPQQFPLPERLRAEFCRVAQLEFRNHRRYSILLADARFNDTAHWSRIATGGGARQSAPESEHWLWDAQGMLVAHSVLSVAWYVVRSVSPLAGVLLGMSDGVVREFANLGISDLAQIAQTRPGWIRPRWADRIDVWSSILASVQAASEFGRPPILRLLKSGATESRRLLNTTNTAGGV